MPFDPVYGAASYAPPAASYTVPIVIESSSRGERSFDIFSRLLKERIVMLHGPVHDGVSALIVAQLLFLEADNREKPIHLYINSPGGSVTAGMAIYDTMQFIQSPVHTVCIGQACSMGSLLLAAGEAGQRTVLPNARVMVHQPSGGASGQAADIAIHAREILALRERLNDIYRKHTGQTIDRIEKAMDRDHFMSPEEAVAFGIVDRIVTTRTPAPPANRTPSTSASPSPASSSPASSSSTSTSAAPPSPSPSPLS